MRRTALPTAAVAAAVLAMAGCSSSPSSTTTAPPSTAHSSTTAPAKAASSSPSSPAGCNLKSKGDILVRYVVPELPTTAQELGGVNLALCELTFKTVTDTSPTGAGYCTTAAWASDNPGYNADAVPAPPLEKVQAQAGAACG